MQRRMSPEYFEERAFAQGVSDSYTAICAAGGSFSLSVRGLRQRLQPHTGAGARLVGQRRAGTPTPRASNCVPCRLASASGYRRGWDFHRAEVGRDLALLRSVLKEDYL